MGQIISPEDFFAADGYLEKLAELVTYFKENDGTDTAFP